MDRDIATIVRKMELVRTCGACPEQYDVLLDGEQVGYLRLRHGHFYADYPDCGGTMVYEASPDGDGIFADYERDHYITAALEAIPGHISSLNKGQADGRRY